MILVIDLCSRNFIQTWRSRGFKLMTLEILSLQVSSFWIKSLHVLYLCIQKGVLAIEEILFILLLALFRLFLF